MKKIQEIRRKWDKRRKDLEWAYYESTWHGMATSIYFMELAAALNRACAEFFWLAAVGLNSQWAERLVRYLITLFIIHLRYQQKLTQLFVWNDCDHGHLDSNRRVDLAPTMC